MSIASVSPSIPFVMRSDLFLNLVEWFFLPPYLVSYRELHSEIGVGTMAFQRSFASGMTRTGFVTNSGR